MPDHIVQAHGHATVVLVDDFVVVTGHPADAPVILNVLPGQLIGTKRGPDAVGFTFVVAETNPAAVSANAAPFFARINVVAVAVVALRIFLSAKGQQRTGNGATMRIQGITQRPDVIAVTDAADNIDDIEAHRRGADIPAPGVILPADGDARPRIRLAAATVFQRTGAPVIVVAAIRIG